MAYDIQDFDELQIYVTDGWREWYIPKFRIFMEVTEPICYVYWTDTEKGSSGLTRLLALDYTDVTFGYIAPSSALEVKNVLDIYITSAFGGGGGVQSVTDDGGGFVVVDNADPLNPIIGFNPEQPVKQETGDYTLAIGDEFNFIEFDDAGDAVNVTVPTNADEPFPIGTWIDLWRDTNEIVNIVPDTGVTVNSIHGWLSLEDEFAQARIIKVGTNEWDLFGDLRRTVDSDAAAYINAIEDAGNTLTEVQIEAIDDLFVELKVGSIYSKMVAMYPFVGGTASAHKFNAINPLDTDAAFRLVFTGSPTHASNGITFNGTTQYADTFLNPTLHLTQDDTHISIVQTNESNAGVAIGIEKVGTQGRFLVAPRTGGFRYSIQYSAAANLIQNSQASSIGRHISTRTSSTVHKLFTNNTQIGATNVTASALWADNNFKVYIGCQSRDNVANGFCAGRFTFASLGAGLSDAEVSILDTAIFNFNTTLGR